LPAHRPTPQRGLAAHQAFVIGLAVSLGDLINLGKYRLALSFSHFCFPL
jgi:hypothetical protein